MSTNTGSQAFPGPHWSEGETGMTLLDWMAGQALVGTLAAGLTGFTGREIAAGCYESAAAMLAEKARREADHSGDANKMVPDHSPDAGNMVELQAANRELVEELEKFTKAVELFTGYGPEVRSALAILAKHKGAA